MRECCWAGSEWPEWELSTIETQTGIKVEIMSQHIFFPFFFFFWFFFFLDDIGRININSTLRQHPRNQVTACSFFLFFFFFSFVYIVNQIGNQPLVTSLYIGNQESSRESSHSIGSQEVREWGNHGYRHKSSPHLLSVPTLGR